MDENRRPIAARRLGVMQGMARFLAARSVSPNAISIASVVFAALGLGAFWLMPGAGGGRIAALLLAALCIQLRLLCNLIDGLVAVEGGQGSATGPFWNEAPDRAADTLFLWGAGLAAGMPALGLGCAVLALATAYLREFGRAEGYAPDFGGPFAKQQRMAALTLGCVVAAFAPGWPVLALALWVIAAGTAATVALRAWRVLGRMG
ncbi:CDP-alcohol phosphatidyltransferase family protein [Rhodobacter sp. NTK016B]|uniref:CDP-alcohol phosphatidyltransferase family protein n=1 Tax=Rhodobacter sp. NTK016B TaxID=2759676 RepID=UPI001A8E1FD3|nr:CDP-alcohol phosphatidyltransferase family protein [Rhodobacter sp. NTK016B]MBN8294195.1 CDP-alcohol phosphatidyltransferase family protein [Rhodobacter sp. NTK016B]